MSISRAVCRTCSRKCRTSALPLIAPSIATSRCDSRPRWYQSSSVRLSEPPTALKETVLSTGNILSVQSTDLLDIYKSLVTRGILKWDEEQVRCVMELRKLLETLEDYEPPLELLRKLSPDAPLLARQVSTASASWWSGKGSRGTDAGARERALVKVLSGEEELANLDTPKGILLTGPPGTGKSYLLSLFFAALPTKHKARHHYHPFLLSLYQSVWRRTQARMAAIPNVVREENQDKASKEGWRSIFAGGNYHSDGGREESDTRRISRTGQEEKESIAFGIARDMILEYHILYFDELQLVDASSASLLRDILSWYWRLGGVIVATSNRLPDDLYHHGVQRQRMAAFLDALKARCVVHEVNGGRDWRLGREEEDAANFNEVDQRWFRMDDKVGFEAAVQKVTGGTEGAKTSVNVYGRKVVVPWASGNVCRFTFPELCEEALGSADYITLSSRFETFIIDEVPLLYLRHKNQARRLINLVDALYESRCKIIVSAEALPEDLFFPDAVDPAAVEDMEMMAAEALSDAVSAPFRPNVSAYAPEASGGTESGSGGDAGRMMRKRDKAPHPSEETSRAFKSLSIFTGEDERFAYKRAVSRLIEMSRGRTYICEEWLPLNESQRRWEKLALSTPPPRPSYLAGKKEEIPAAPQERRVAPITSQGEGAGVDFASEAAFSRTATGGKAAGPPVISENHVWGVQEEWGPKAGEWGKGTRARRGKKEVP